MMREANQPFAKTREQREGQERRQREPELPRLLRFAWVHASLFSSGEFGAFGCSASSGSGADSETA